MPRSPRSANSRLRLSRVVGQILEPHGCASIGLKKVLIANRGEITVRICRAAKALSIKTVVIYTEQDEGAWHMKNPNVDEAVKLPAGATPIAPYLDIENIIKICKSTGADCAHPGYGFLAESAAFVRRLKEEGIKFIGPSPDCIELFGDKTAARAHAEKTNVPVLPGSHLCRSVAEAEDFLRLKGSSVRWPLLIKAAFGGGGRGQKVVKDPAKFAESFDACSKEAELGFGDGGCFIEEYLEDVRHIEIQLLGNGRGQCTTLYERDCSAQLRNQKVIEVAPARDMSPELRKKICDAAIRLGEGCNYENAGTVEFLVSGSLADANSRFVFLEMNPRIQVEHTITEEVTGADLVQTQFLIAGGADFADVVKAGKLPKDPVLNGFAFQLRITATPGGGPLKGYKEPEGRVDSGIVEGSTVSMEYDPLLAKLIVHSSGDWESCRALAYERLAAFVIEGPNTNRKLLNGILNHPRFKDNQMYTNFIDANKDALEGKAKKKGAAIGEVLKIQPPFPGQIAEVKVNAGDAVDAGDVLAVINAMKMLTDIVAPCPGIVKEVTVAAEAQVMDETVMFAFEVTGEAPADEEEDASWQSASTIVGLPSGGGSPVGYTTSSWHAQEPTLLHSSSPVLRSKIKTSDKTFKMRKEVNLERVKLLQERLAEASMGGSEKSVALHRSRGKKLPRERIRDIIDPGTKFMELSPLAMFGRGDGKSHGAAIVTGIGVVHGRECMFIANDGSIGGGAFSELTMKKQDRAQAIALQNLLPTIYLVDGGGAKLDPSAAQDLVPAVFVDGGRAFKTQALMSGKNLPQVAAVCGMCTAGAAYIPAMCDESVIVKGNGTVYLGGPPLVKAATGEDAEEQDLGGGAMHTSQSGVVDHLAEDEPAALAMVRAIAEHFNTCTKFCPPGMRAPEPPKYDPEEILGIIPEDNKIPFDMREVIARIVDGSRFHEFKPRYGSTLICGFAHIEGYPVGMLANNGMLFSQAAVKGAHFIQVCGQRKIPLIFLHNITGFMIGTEFEKGGITKDGAKMITAVSCVQVPKFSIICGGSHGAGNYAMCGHAYDPRFTFLWPNAKISVMGGEQMVGTMAYVRAKAAARDGKAPMDFEGTLKQTTAMAAPMIKAWEDKSDAYTSTANIYDDGIIDPRETRSVLARGVSIAMNAVGNESIFPEKYGVFRM